MTTRTYDAKNRLLSVTDGLGNTTTYTYDSAGNLTVTTDANGHETTSTYDSANRLSSTTDALGNVTTFEYDPSGNQISVTDANNHTTQYTWDEDERNTVVTLPDGNQVTYAYDGFDRVRATTTPNGNQSDAAAINLVNAFNWLQNPGAETVSPYSSSQAQNWAATPTSASNIRDTTVSHTGQASLKLALASEATQYWAQGGIPFPSGATGVLQMWARPDGSATPSGVSAQVTFYANDTSPQLFSSPALALPTDSTTWQQLAPFVFSAPADGQYRTFSVDSVTLSGVSSGSPTVWFDDATMYSVSSGSTYDAKGNLQWTIGADGAQVEYQRDRYGRVVGMCNCLTMTIQNQSLISEQRIDVAYSAACRTVIRPRTECRTHVLTGEMGAAGCVR